MDKRIPVGTTWTVVPRIFGSVAQPLLGNHAAEAVRAVILDSDGTEVEVVLPPGMHRLPSNICPQAVRAWSEGAVVLIAGPLGSNGEWSARGAECCPWPVDLPQLRH